MPALDRLAEQKTPSQQPLETVFAYWLAGLSQQFPRTGSDQVRRFPLPFPKESC
jgi:hypothetical protein